MNSKRKSVLITGGLGYIGSHIVIKLLKKQYSVIIIDDLSNSSLEVLNKIKTICKLDGINYKRLGFYNFDVKNSAMLDNVFFINRIDYVVHMAAHKAVGESIENPLMYYRNNIDSLLVLLNCMKKNNVNNLIFSSSATVYGNSEPPFNEFSETGKGLTNPYGKTKFMCEEILKDINDMNIYLLRYFNPIGCHESGIIGDDPNGIPNNIMPYLLRVANGEYEKLSIFGDDYDTKDGTAERDYIHVNDLAEAHVLALKGMKKGTHIFNVGTGNSTSVLKLVNTFENINNIKVNYEVTKRREGDVGISYCNSDKIKEELGWIDEYSLEDMCRDSWNFIKNKNNTDNNNIKK